jgi:DNA-binding response OmpR family regulator
MVCESHVSSVALVASAQDRVLSACQQHLPGDEFEIHTCRSGIECLHALRDSRVDVLILDTALPWGGADGILELLKGANGIIYRPLVFLVATEVSADLLYRVSRYRVDDFQIGLHDRSNLGTRVRQLVQRHSEQSRMAGQRLRAAGSG